MVYAIISTEKCSVDANWQRDDNVIWRHWKTKYGEERLSGYAYTCIHVHFLDIFRIGNLPVWNPNLGNIDQCGRNQFCCVEFSNEIHYSCLHMCSNDSSCKPTTFMLCNTKLKWGMPIETWPAWSKMVLTTENACLWTVRIWFEHVQLRPSPTCDQFHVHHRKMVSG